MKLEEIKSQSQRQVNEHNRKIASHLGGRIHITRLNVAKYNLYNIVDIFNEEMDSLLINKEEYLKTDEVNCLSFSEEVSYQLYLQGKHIYLHYDRNKVVFDLPCNICPSCLLNEEMPSVKFLHNLHEFIIARQGDLGNYPIAIVFKRIIRQYRSFKEFMELLLPQELHFCLK